MHLKKKHNIHPWNVLVHFAQQLNDILCTVKRGNGIPKIVKNTSTLHIMKIFQDTD